MKIALVLGGTYPHRALIQKLKDRGYYTILVDYLDHPAAQECADEHLQESTLDMERVCELAKERNAELVISTCVDQANVTCCYVAEKLGLPKPYTYAASLNVTDKVRMKQIMIDNQIPTARHYTIASLKEFDANKLRFPIIVKPADCNSSKGVRRIEKNDADTENYIQDALSLSRNGEAIIEEFLVGREIGADCMIINHRAHVVMTRERRKINKNNTDAIQQIYGSFWPADLSEKNIEQLRLIAEKIALAFGIDNTPLMMQTILAHDEFNVIEFGARIGGGDNYQIIEELTGYDIIQNSIRSFLGEPIEISDLGKRQKLMMDTYLYVNPPRDGSDEEQLFGCITYNDIARSNFEYEKCYRKKGDSIGYKISSNNRVGCFVVSGTSEQELLDKQALVIANMEVYDMDGHPIMRKDIY
jgi:biotin carboxylase